MRTVIAIALALSCVIGAAAMSDSAEDAGASNSIKVLVVDFHSNDGEADCVLFGSPQGFPSDSKIAMKKTKSKIENRQAVCVFSGVTPGDYAVSVFHDENANGTLDRNFIGIFSLALDPRDQCFSRNFSHLTQRLSDGGEARAVECGALNIIEAYDGDIRWNAQAGFLKGAYCADRGDVIVSKERGEWFLAAQQLLSIGITQLRRRIIDFNLHN